MNDKKPVDFLKAVEGIKKTQEVEMKEGFRQLRKFYLELLEAGFTMKEAMAYLAALTNPQSNKKNKEE
jgi:hypothetical protein